MIEVLGKPNEVARTLKLKRIGIEEVDGVVVLVLKKSIRGSSERKRFMV